MYIVNGVIKYKEMNDENVLHVKISNEGTRQLLENISNIISEYKKHVSTICLEGSEGDVNEVVSAMKIIHRNGMKTCYKVPFKDVHDTVDKLLDELDYIILHGGKIMKRDYCAFGDFYDWIDVQ